MKTIYVRHILGKIPLESEVTLWGWVKSRRKHKGVTFLDITDSTGTIQTVLDRSLLSEGEVELLSRLAIESAVRIEGKLKMSPWNNTREIEVSKIELVGAAKQVSPPLRSSIDIFDTASADHLLRNRHLYLRNPKTMAILQFRSLMMGAVAQWFRERDFVEITAPVLTPLPLYDDGTAMSIKVHDQNVFLTQCVGYYLESAVHAFERVYNMGPSFRGEESRSKRHLMEYWHIKAELAFCDRNDLMELVESLVAYVTRYFMDAHPEIFETLGRELCTDGLSIPFPRISYREALEILGKSGENHAFGTSLGSEEEEILSREFDGPFWIVGIPRSIEPFPYVIDPDDPQLTMTADLIASRGYGELLGVAEKIPDLASLDERMKEKGRYGKPEYDWLREIREMGCVPHGGFGMGVERMIRWLLQIPHVRDAIPFPRTFRRHIHP